MVRWLALALTLWVTSSVRAEGTADLEARARAFEARFLAPCCYQQTMDVHDSPLTSELRREIRQRLARGESPDLVERDFVARYGARVVAVPAGSPLEGLALVAMLSVFAAGLALWWRARRWVRRGAAATESPAVDDPYDRALDEELRALDG